MDHVKYPTITEGEMSNIHEEHKTQVVKDFTEAAKSLNKVSLHKELEVGFMSMIQKTYKSCFIYEYTIVTVR